MFDARQNIVFPCLTHDASNLRLLPATFFGELLTVNDANGMPPVEGTLGSSTTKLTIRSRSCIDKPSKPSEKTIKLKSNQSLKQSNLAIGSRAKKQGRIHGHQLRTGGQGRKSVFSHFSTQWLRTDGRTDRRTDGRTDGQSLL